MRDRIPTKVLDNGAVRYAVYDESGKFLRYEYMLPADEPTDPGTPLSKSTIMTDDVEALIWGAAADRTPNDAFDKISELYQHWWSVLLPAGATTYEHSPDRNAYPDSGTVDGLTYTYMGKPFENARNAAKIEMGSYVGTGKYGSSNTNSLTFSFKPKFVLIRRHTYSSSTSDSTWVAIFPVHRLSESYSGSGQIGWQYVGEGAPYTYSNARNAKIEGNTLTWYTTQNNNGASEQLNVSGATFGYVAIR